MENPEKFSAHDMAEMNQSRAESDAELIKDGAEAGVTPKGDLSVRPSAEQQDEIHKDFENKTQILEYLSSPEFQSQLGELKNLADSLNDDFQRALSRVDLEQSIGGNESSRLGDFANKLKSFLGVEEGTLSSSVKKYGNKRPEDWLPKNSSLAKNLNYSDSVQGQNQDYYDGKFVQAMLKQEMSPAQLLEMIEDKMKASQWDAAKDVGKI